MRHRAKSRSGEDTVIAADARSVSDEHVDTGCHSELRRHPRVHWSGASLADTERCRIVSLVPSLSEALHALGLGDRDWSA